MVTGGSRSAHPPSFLSEARPPPPGPAQCSGPFLGGVRDDDPVTVPDAVPALWRDQSLWSLTANRMKKRIERARLLALILVVVVAICGTAAGAFGDAHPMVARVLSLLAAAGAAALPFLRPGWSGTRLRDWTRARSVSEALKTEIYLWLAGAGRYRNDADAVELRRRADEVWDAGADLLRHQRGIVPAERALPQVHDLSSYFTVRVLNQIDRYYQLKAGILQARLTRFRRAEIGLGLAGALLGVFAASSKASAGPWIAVLATLATALAVHVSASRYEYQVIEFLRTAEMLRRLVRDAEATTSDVELEAMARRAENVISVENQGWMVKLAEEPPDYPAPGNT